MLDILRLIAQGCICSSYGKIPCDLCRKGWHYYTHMDKLNEQGLVVGSNALRAVVTEKGLAFLATMERLNPPDQWPPF